MKHVIDIWGGPSLNSMERNMPIFRMPEGSDLTVNIYIKGKIVGEDTEMEISLSGLPAFSDEVLEKIDIDHLVKEYRLSELGTDWRLMTAAEISAYKREKAEQEKDGHAVTFSADDLEESST